MAITVNEKRCTVCREVKSLDAFHRSPNNKGDGRKGRCKSCTSVEGAARYAADPDKYRSAVMKARYGITLEDYETMRVAQNHRCGICGRHEDDCPTRGGRGQNERLGGLVIDHDHETGRVRGLLCIHCNLGLGYLEAARASLGDVAAYLEGRR